MFFKLFTVALAASTVAAHGKISVVTGDAGGNGTALGIQGGIVPGAGSNSKTEVDTTVFGSTKIATDGLGATTGGGKNTVAKVASTMKVSGRTLPQVSAGNGTLSGTVHIVTTDGAGPFSAMIDSTGTGAFSTGTKAVVTTQVPGKKGNINPNGTTNKRSLLARTLIKYGLMKRAANVNKNFPIKIAIPAGTSCTGTAGGQSNVCLVKIANANPAGPFGGVVAMQIAA